MKNNKRDILTNEELKEIRNSELIVNTTVWVNKSLYRRFCQSQNYYYTRDINEIMAEANSKAVVRYKDFISYDEDDEYLKRFYQLEEYPQKIQLLTEYYKFHTDITRIFMEPIATILNKYYDKKRKFEYYRIAKLIEEENKKNPNRPPKGIVGERPSPIHSHESEQEEIQEEQNKQKSLVILKDLSFLNKTYHLKQEYQSQANQKTHNKLDISQTLQELCKNFGAQQQLEHSSLCLGQNVKVEEQKLSKFLNYLNQQEKQSQENKKQQQPYQSKLTKKLSQPQEQLIQQIIQQQLSQNKISTDDLKLRLGSQHNPKENQLSLKSPSQQQTQFNFVKCQVDTVSSYGKKQQYSTEAPHSSRFDQKTIESSKGQNSQVSSKAKTITGHQPKISNQMFLKDFKGNANMNQPLQMKSQKTQSSVPQNIQPKINLKQISKLFIQSEEDPNDSELKWKNGSQTHRPMSGTQNFFNSNRNSPAIYQQQKGYQLLNENQLKFIKGKSGAQALSKNKSPQQIYRKSTQPNIHIRQTSNQERVININININDHPEYLKCKQTSSQQKHKKHCSDGKCLNFKGSYGDSQQEIGCLTDRAGLSSEFLFKNNLTSQSSPKQQMKRQNSGQRKSNPSSLHSNQNRGTLIQQMINQVSKKGNQHQKNDFLHQLHNFQRFG